MRKTVLILLSGAAAGGSLAWVALLVWSVGAGLGLFPVPWLVAHAESNTALSSRRTTPICTNIHLGRQKRLPGRCLFSDIFFSLSYLPYLHCSVAVCRGDVFAVGQPYDSVGRVWMSLIRQDIAPGGSVPDLHAMIFACRSDALAIGRPYDRPHPGRMTVIGVKQAIFICIQIGRAHV